MLLDLSAWPLRITRVYQGLRDLALFLRTWDHRGVSEPSPGGQQFSRKDSPDVELPRSIGCIGNRNRWHGLPGSSCDVLEIGGRNQLREITCKQRPASVVGR